MKAKSLIVVLVVVSVLLIYSVICYRLLNERIEVTTKNTVANYFSSNIPQVSSFDYLKAISREKNTFQVFVTTNVDDYTFYFQYSDHEYQLLDVESGIPSYRKFLD